jgi:hypothetical protein
MRGEKYFAPVAAALSLAIGATACGLGNKSKFELCKSMKSSNGQIIDSTGTWAERTADSLACFMKSEQQKDPKGVKVAFRDGTEVIRIIKQVKSHIKGERDATHHHSGTGLGRYELTTEITGWPHGNETVNSVEVLVNGGLKDFDPIYLLAIFKEHGHWSFDQEIVQRNGWLASVDSGTPGAKNSYSDIANLAAQIACEEAHGDPVNWISPDHTGTKQVASDCSPS